MRRRIAPILIALTTFLAGCSVGDAIVSPRVCPPYPEMPAEAKAYLQACCTVDPDGGGVGPRTPSAGSEPLWSWLGDIAVLREQLAACR